jgi:Flp pilus assembly protein TadB
MTDMELTARPCDDSGAHWSRRGFRWIAISLAFGVLAMVLVVATLLATWSWVFSFAVLVAQLATLARALACWRRAEDTQ